MKRVILIVLIGFNILGVNLLVVITSLLKEGKPIYWIERITF